MRWWWAFFSLWAMYDYAYAEAETQATDSLRISFLERRLKTACANEIVGEGRASAAIQILLESERLQSDLRARLKAMMTFVTAPIVSQKTSAALLRKKEISKVRQQIRNLASSAYDRVHSNGNTRTPGSLSAQTSDDQIRRLTARLNQLMETQEREEYGADPVSERERQKEIQRRQEVYEPVIESTMQSLNHLDKIASRANSCYSVACSLVAQDGKFSGETALCGESERINRLNADSAVSRERDQFYTRTSHWNYNSLSEGANSPAQ